MIRDGMLVVIVLTEPQNFQWDPSWAPSYPLGITEHKTRIRQNEELWSVRTSSKISHLTAEKHLVPLIDIPVEDRGLSPAILLQKHQERVIVRLAEMCSRDS